MHVQNERPIGPHIEIEALFELDSDYYGDTFKRTFYMPYGPEGIDSHIEYALSESIGECEERGWIEEILDYKIWHLTPPQRK